MLLKLAHRIIKISANKMTVTKFKAEHRSYQLGCGWSV